MFERASSALHCMQMSKKVQIFRCFSKFGETFMRSGSGRALKALVVVTLCLQGVIACTQAPRQDAAQAPQQPPAEETTSVDPQEAARRKAEQRQEMIDRLLDQAEEAVADNRLTLPLHDNAYDRYAAVRILEPDNARAKAGLDSILLSYAELTRAALRKGRLNDARQLLDRAESFYGGNPLLKDIEKDIQQAEALARQRAQRLQQQAADSDEFILPAQELSRKSPAVIDLLARVAERLRETDESILIRARTDAEGRWIYKQMSEAVPGYRIRGDIRVSSTPKLQLLPPL